MDHQPQANIPSAEQTPTNQPQGAMALQHPLQPHIIEPIIPSMVKFADKSTGQAYNALITMAAKEDDPHHIPTEQEIAKKGLLGKIFTDNLSNQERQILGAEHVEQINSGQLAARQLAQVIKSTSTTTVQPRGILSTKRTHSDTTPAVHQTPPPVPHDKTFTKDFPDIPSWNRNQEIMNHFSEQSPAPQNQALNLFHQNQQPNIRNPTIAFPETNLQRIETTNVDYTPGNEEDDNQNATRPNPNTNTPMNKNKKPIKTKQYERRNMQRNNQIIQKTICGRKYRQGMQENRSRLHKKRRASIRKRS